MDRGEGTAWRHGWPLACCCRAMLSCGARERMVVDEARGGDRAFSPRRVTCPRGTGWKRTRHIRRGPRPLRLETGRGTCEHMPRQAVVAQLELQERAAATYPSLSPLQSCVSCAGLELASARACMCWCLSGPDWLQESLLPSL
jgi:hypothetical protein